MAYRIAGAEDFALEVRAPTAREFACALDEEGDAARQRALIALVLWSGGTRAFRVSGGADLLYCSEFDALWSAVWRALDRIAPSRSRSDERAWFDQLRDGASARDNLSIMAAMADSRDLNRAYGYKPAWLPRPDRYYGRATCELTEGQLLAYRAACDAAD